jgi:hypothetical protein
MHHQQCDRADDPDRMPALLATLDPIENDGVQRIVPDPPCKIERNAMLGAIGRGFRVIPFEYYGGFSVLTFLYLHS